MQELKLICFSEKGPLQKIVWVTLGHFVSL